MPSRSALRNNRRASPGAADPLRAETPGRSHQELEALILERTRALADSQHLLRTTLDQMDQGLVLLDQSQTVRLYNPRALELLRLSQDVLHENAAFSDIRAFQNERGDFTLIPSATTSIISGSDTRQIPLVYDWPRPDGTTLEVRRVQLADGSSVNTFTDVTERRAVESAISASELRCRLLAERVEKLAQIDELTGALNRRFIMQALAVEIARAERGAKPCSVAMIDLDFFKRINDRFGHLIGDEVLRSFAIAVSANVRQIDQFGRYGGEEFLLVLPRVSTEQALVAVDRLREIVAALDWTGISNDLVVTISAGVTQFRFNEESDDLLARADAALYRAKDSGRNCVVSA
jgi:diguanylate cyclase (GGDEF)-like protein